MLGCSESRNPRDVLWSCQGGIGSEASRWQLQRRMHYSLILTSSASITIYDSIRFAFIISTFDSCTFFLLQSSTFDLLPFILTSIHEATIYGVQLALINGVVLVADTYDAIHACRRDACMAYLFSTKRIGYCYGPSIFLISTGDTFFDDLLLPFTTNILIFSFLLSSICMLD